MYVYYVFVYVYIHTYKGLYCFYTEISEITRKVFVGTPVVVFYIRVYIFGFFFVLYFNL